MDENWWSNEKLFSRHPYHDYLFDSQYQQEQIDKFGAVLFSDLPSYIDLQTPYKIAGLLCRFRLKVSKLRQHLH